MYKYLNLTSASVETWFWDGKAKKMGICISMVYNTRENILG